MGTAKGAPVFSANRPDLCVLQIGGLSSHYELVEFLARNNTYVPEYDVDPRQMGLFG